MNTSNLMAVIVLLAATLAAYVTGFRAGKREGFESGKEAGRKENSSKAFAVGYDRGKRERPAPEAEPATSRQAWIWIVGFVTIMLLCVLEVVLSNPS